MDTLEGTDKLAPTSDITEGRHNLDEFGFTIHKNFLSKSRVADLRDRIEEQASRERQEGVAAFYHQSGEANCRHKIDTQFIPEIGRPRGLPLHQVVLCLVNKGNIFIELAKHPVALEYAKHIFRDISFNVGAQTGVILRKGAPAQRLHTDQQIIPFYTPVPVMMAMSIALGEYTEQMGATRIVPGSHKCDGNKLEACDEILKRAMPIHLEPGDAAFWESRTWHGQGAVYSDNPRYSIAMFYIAHFLQMPECYPAAIHDQVYNAMSDEDRLLYGFGYGGFGGRIGPRNETDTRSNVYTHMPYVPELKFLNKQEK